ncbi:hypothetical protein BKP35_10415 [Anaerobacillus arseniciselenatis]|uniref:Uncharacterized protein n=1 Tax=Anaerobacillus arseniciselenatis TaxID=85682 RepID=A0A1S2LKV1_9BACI|nr:phBC6A51 family helix-turn-helix protein [Anaerobacillus arseniciselenatis]OIJ12964.1 hypothetical protein BKP35_10415 [Anaerobacillus arseniciselenatis]
MSKADSLLETITVPQKLSEQQVKLARQYVKASMQEGFTVAEFCKSNSISTASWYSWMNDEPAFKHYLNQLQDAVIPSDEKLAFQKIKQHILKIAEKQNPSIKEIELFTDTFSYVVEADKRERLEALGISEKGSPNSNDFRTLEERKNALLSRLND